MIVKNIRNIFPLPKSWEKDDDLRNFGIRINDAIRVLFSQKNAYYNDISSSVSTTSASTKNVLSITLPAGEWMVTGKIVFEGDASGARGMAITTGSSFSWAGSTCTIPVASVSASLALNGTEYIRLGKETAVNLLAFQNSGSSLNVTAANITAVRITAVLKIREA